MTKADREKEQEYGVLSGCPCAVNQNIVHPSVGGKMSGGLKLTVDIYQQVSNVNDISNAAKSSESASELNFLPIASTCR